MMLRAELLKLSTTRATAIALAVGILGLIATQLVLVTLLPAIASGAIGPGADAVGDDLPDVDMTSPAGQLAALSPLGASTGSGSIGLALLAVLILGVLAGTTDFRHGGIVPTALARPRRGGILAAKSAAVGLTGIAVGIAYAVVSIGALVVSLAVQGTPLVLGAGEILMVLLRGAVVVALLALLGLGVGLLARSQLAGVLIALGALVLELMVQGFVQLATGGLPTWAQLLPLSLSQLAIGSVPATIPPLLALLVLAVWAAIVLGASWLVIRRRDL